MSREGEVPFDLAGLAGPEDVSVSYACLLATNNCQDPPATIPGPLLHLFTIWLGLFGSGHG